MKKITFYAYRNFLLPAVFVLSLIFLSCQNDFDLESEKADFYLPQWPPESNSADEGISYPGLYGWQLSIRSFERSEDFFIAADKKKITVEVRRNEALCLCASPVTLLSDGSKCQFFKMAGGLYPFFAEGDGCDGNLKVSLSWEGGFTSCIMKRIVDSAAENNLSKESLKSFLKEFNWKKMNEKILSNSSASSEKFYNPWHIEQQLLLENLSQGLFDSDYLNTKYIFSLSEEPVESAGQTVDFNDDFLSSYIPQNQAIKETGLIVLKKNTRESFLVSNLYSLDLTASSAKKVSASLTYMPILIDEYGYP